MSSSDLFVIATVAAARSSDQWIEMFRRAGVKIAWRSVGAKDRTKSVLVWSKETLAVEMDVVCGIVRTPHFGLPCDLVQVLPHLVTRKPWLHYFAKRPVVDLGILRILVKSAERSY